MIFCASGCFDWKSAKQSVARTGKRRYHECMELTRTQKEKLREIGERHNLRFIILHGSYAAGTPRKGSDVDIAVLGNRRIGFAEVLELHGAFADVFGDSPERELDLKTLHGVDPLFRYQVTRDGVLLFGSATDYEEFKAYAYRDYMDSFDLRELEFALLKKSIQALSERYALQRNSERSSVIPR